MYVVLTVGQIRLHRLHLFVPLYTFQPIQKLFTESCCFHFLAEPTSYVNLSRFHSIFPKKSGCSMLFNSGAHQRVRVYLTLASPRLKAECCTVHVRTTYWANMLYCISFHQLWLPHNFKIAFTFLFFLIFFF